jgi:two-component system, OmpR family, phosphate regulon response regulator PhoB
MTMTASPAGGEALGRIRDTHPDLVLLDVMLPEVSGYEICQGVRLDPTLSDVKILMMTARGSAIERKKGMALGADGFITKPFELKELRHEVRRLLGRGLRSCRAVADPGAGHAPARPQGLIARLSLRLRVFLFLPALPQAPARRWASA